MLRSREQEFSTIRFSETLKNKTHWIRVFPSPRNVVPSSLMSLYSQVSLALNCRILHLFRCGWGEDSTDCWSWRRPPTKAGYHWDWVLHHGGSQWTGLEVHFSEQWADGRLGDPQSTWSKRESFTETSSVLQFPTFHSWDTSSNRDQCRTTTSTKCTNNKQFKSFKK